LVKGFFSYCIEKGNLLLTVAQPGIEFWGALGSKFSEEFFFI
jgi:hypothetical protein